MRKLKNLFCILWVSFFSLVLFSCSTEEEESGVVSYTMGFDTVQSSDLSDLAVIESAYKTALGLMTIHLRWKEKFRIATRKYYRPVRKWKRNWTPVTGMAVILSALEIFRQPKPFTRRPMRRRFLKGTSDWETLPLGMTLITL